MLELEILSLGETKYLHVTTKSMQMPNKIYIDVVKKVCNK